MQRKLMSPRDYFERIVKPTVEDYCANKCDHHTENAVFQLSSFSERYFKFHLYQGNTDRIFKATNPKKFGEALTGICPEYGLLWKAANAVKHQLPDGRVRPGTMLTASTQVWNLVTEYEIGADKVTIAQAIITVYDFWQRRILEESE